MATLRELVRQTHKILDASNIPDSRLEAEVMLMSVMSMVRHGLYSAQEIEASVQQERELEQMVQRRLKREPLAYIVGQKEFYGITLMVSPSVMIPRPETELLVEHALFMALMGMETRDPVLADVGTGSGAIAVNLAIHLPAFRIYAIDSSEGAIDVASYNIRAHNVVERITLLKGDVLEPMPEPSDIIVANLPYIPSNRIRRLQPEIQWEPKEALDGGADGLDLIRRLLSQASHKLKDHGSMLLELDPDQVPAIQEMAHQLFPNASTHIEIDMAGQNRLLVINQSLGE
jgi:release factor glutamine methyltransferase